MKKRALGPHAPKVFPVGFGGMALSEIGRPSEAEAIKVIHAVLDAGVQLLDLSNVYGNRDDEVGHNERLFAKALKSWSGPRDRIVVATKGGRWRYQRRWEIDARPDQLRIACEQSLKALGVDRIDLYQLNVPDPNVPFAESMGALSDLQSEGKIRWVGVSNVDLGQIRIASSLVQLETVQNRLNPFFRESLKRAVVQYCAEEQLGFLAYHSVGGWLSGQLGRNRLLQRIGRRHGVSPYAATIAWELAQSPNVIPLVSARTIEHALDSFSGAEVCLDSDEVRAINDAYFPRISTSQYLRNRVGRSIIGRKLKLKLKR